VTAPAIGSGSGQPPPTTEVVPAPVAPPPAPGHPLLVSWGRFVATFTGIRFVSRVVTITVAAVRKAWSHRILGLSAEAGFWQLLSLPSLAFALIGLLGYLGSSIGADTIARLRANILDSASHSLTPDTVNSLVKPILNGVLSNHHAGVISVGFVISLWSGSSAMATFVNTITIAYDQRDLRGAVASRFLALGLYVASVLGTVVMLPVLVLGPAIIRSWDIVHKHHVISNLIAFAYWPVVALVSLGALCTLYHLAVPVRPRWRDTIPGAVAAAGLWIVGSVGLRAYVQWVFHRNLDYGALAAPVAILLFCYITAMAVLLGAEINAEMDRRRAARTTHDSTEPPTLVA
jgi:membrane protein